MSREAAWTFKSLSAHADRKAIVDCMKLMCDLFELVEFKNLEGMSRWGAAASVELWKLLQDGGGLLHKCFDRVRLPP